MDLREVTILSFYKELSRVYDIVFKKDDTTVDFLKKDLSSRSEILDLACGTGTYALELAKDGHDVIGIDLDSDMIEKAKIKASSNSARFYCEDMRSFRKITEDRLSDRIFCIGNSLVHLKDKSDIRKFIKTIYDSLKEDGSMIIQIINYDRILDNGVTKLPTIDRSSEGVKFIRNYNVSKDKSTLDFDTELIISSDGEERAYKNSIPLLALRSEEIIEILKDVGFSELEVYSDFDETIFNKDSFALVIKCYH